MQYRDLTNEIHEDAPIRAPLNRSRAEVIKVENALLEIASFSHVQAADDEFYLAVHEIISGFTQVDNLLLAAVDQSTGKIDISFHLNHNPQDCEYVDPESVERRAIINLVVQSQQLVHINRNDIYRIKVSRGLDPDVSQIAEDALALPLSDAHGLAGVLLLESFAKGFRYSEKEKEHLQAIAAQLQISLAQKMNADALRQSEVDLKGQNRELQGLLDEREEIHQRLMHNATHDALTGLPNRTLFLKRLRQTLHHARMKGNQKYAILFVDLDRFKVVNDSLGHLIGDGLLVEVGCRLRHCVHSSALVSRLGGDEFCVLLTEDATPSVVKMVAKRILDNLQQPMFLDGQRVVTSSSIGIAFGDERYDSAMDMLRDADTALYQAKAAGRSTFKVFNQSMREKAVLRMEMEQALRQAIEDEAIDVFYQPIVDLQTGQLVSFEALARWFHPTLGSVPASTFVPIAEEIHMISAMTEFILEKAIRQISRWRTEFVGLRDLGVNVNISPMQIESQGFVDSIKHVLAGAGLPPRSLKLEVTESMLLNNAERAGEVLNELHDLNVRLALDDFGTGYSSLFSLNSLPLDELKIDLSFVQNIVDDERSDAIVQMIVALAQVMNLQVVAEGVETVEQLQILRDLGAQRGQGYLFGAPASEASIYSQLSKTNPNRYSTTDTIPFVPARFN